ncbi:MAG: metal ABC transporter permease, partial [Defluviitaleaceae bacterium]|nr:metal ABC transporter permease [Defluviitaleaceae bacterium]
MVALIDNIQSFIHTITTHDFMGRAALAAVLVGIVASTIGVFVILRGLSLMGDAIGHAVIPGVALGHIAGNAISQAVVVPSVALTHLLGNMHLIGAIVFGVLASFTIGFIVEKSKLKKDVIIGIVFSSFFALGVVLISRIRTGTNLMDVLFGNVLTTSRVDIITIAIIGVLLILFIILFYKELLITSFDETLAKVYGMKTRLIHYGFLLMLTIVIVASLQIVGAILIVSMIIAPAATAYLLTT